jgi:hypothetical protein
MPFVNKTSCRKKRQIILSLISRKYNKHKSQKEIFFITQEHVEASKRGSKKLIKAMEHIHVYTLVVKEIIGIPQGMR